MGSTAAVELRLDLMPPVATAVRAATGFFIREAAAAAMTTGDVEGKEGKLEEYVRGLEEELRKIEAFKRELPLCMVIVTDVIEELKEELEQCRGRGKKTSTVPVLEEFMPMEGKFETAGANREKENREKKNWMSSVQLWSDNHTGNTNSKNIGTQRTEEGDRRPGGAFLPFKGLSSFAASCRAREEEKPAVATPPPLLPVSLPELSLVSLTTKTSSRVVSVVPEEQCHRGANSMGGSSSSSRAVVVPSPANARLGLPAQPQGPRKARRCWSPELHRRFVGALQQLGGSQVATPKQIRDLMKVDGLTNDEVKSHLQKYRLHTRRLTPATSSAPAAVGCQQPVVMREGLWVPLPEHHYPVLKQSSNSQSRSPQGPLQLAGGGGDGGGFSVTGGSGDTCEEEEDEEEEDGRSEEHYSWRVGFQRSTGAETD